MASAPCSPSPAAAARAPRSAAVPGSSKKLTCLCSPTNHPGSFRCSRHRNGPRGSAAPSGGEAGPRGRPAMGRSVRALLLQRISCPSDRDRQRQRRRSGEFQPRPSRLRLMNM
ncbi:uncharacterized protein LOC120656483 [Panicum virgatum]|uniref:Serine-rich protein n=1 Tax=Panicum virgatum TaxID=38727 RepID=A0A8T0XRH6_PANVG|nr:uncharacterized protein LOC120656483 [Panicum virgatum]KAG2662287.1 hypothetical protein PVAP13_1KG521100 [Panicum virgatum]